MKRLPLGLLLLASAWASALAAAPHPAVSDEVWIALRADGAKGRGTEGDPYDGSTAARMKALFTALPPGVRLHFGAGTFPLQPVSHFDAGGPVLTGAEVKSGWKIEGAGEGRTLFRADYAGLKPDPHGMVYTLLQGGLAEPGGLDGFVLRGVTLDCAPGADGALLPSPAASASALGIAGTRCLVEDVEMVGGYYGGGASGRGELFFAAMGRPPDADGEGNVVRRCRLHAMADSRGIDLLLACSGWGETSRANRDVLFEGNDLDGLDAQGHLAAQGLNWFTVGKQSSLPHFRMAGNTVRHCQNALYGDTAATPLDHCEIVGNTIDVAPEGVGVYVLHALSNMLVEGNVFRFAGPRGHGISVGQGAPAIAGLLVCNNLFRGPKLSSVSFSHDPNVADAVIVRNRTEGPTAEGVILHAEQAGAGVSASENVEAP